MTQSLTKFAIFRWTGQRPSADEDALPTGVRPALFAAYRDLTRLRYDYPLVLVDRPSGTEWLRSLTDVVDEVLRGVAPRGADGEGMRQQVLRLEREVRRLAAEEGRRRLIDTWDRATAVLLATADRASRDVMASNLAAARAALPCDGPLLDCSSETPIAVLGHAWSAVHKAKAQRFRARAATVLRRVEDILRSDAMASEEGRSPAMLSRGFGPSFAAAFDYDAMSRMLHHCESRHAAIPASRRARLEGIVSALGNQRFYPLDPAQVADGGTLPFLFESCRAALDAYHARLPEMVAVIKALAVGELEVENRYREEKHSALFDGLNERAVSREELAGFPACLAVLRGEPDATETAALREIATSDHPIKVILLRDDILEGAESAHGRLAAGAEAWGLPRMSLGLDDCFVMQASAARLCGLRNEIRRGLEFEGPALYSVFSGAMPVGADEGNRLSDSGSPVPPYLLAAAATESRAFPSFVFDPGGEDWASRLRIDDNPQVEADWPVHGLDVEDAGLQRRTYRLAFTYADFVACHPRHATRFVRMSGEDFGGQTAPVGDGLDHMSANDDGTLPVVPTVDEKDALAWLVPDRGVLDATRRCRAAWRNLQELAGIHNSHARRLLEREREAWEREKEAELKAIRKPADEPAQKGVAESAVEAATEETNSPAHDAVSSEDPWIETARCTTCNECTNINSRMFAYNENMQAYIADRDAGSYRELVEAAESCQVAIIHPGKPRNPNEPGVDELLRRAEPFA